MKPLLFGYQCVRLGAEDDADEGLRNLSSFAAREGFALGAVFTDEDVNRPMAAFAALVGAVQGSAAEVEVAVAVPRVEDLGLSASVRHMMRQRLEREGVRVLVVPDMPPKRAAQARPGRVPG